MSPGLVYILATVLGVLGLVLASATEIACYSVNPVRLSLRTSGPRPSRAARRLAAELARPDRMLATLMIASNVFGYVLTFGLAPLIDTGDDSAGRELLLDVAVITPLTLILGEILPKELARVEADRIAYALSGPLRLARAVLTWTGLLPAVMWFANLVERWGGLTRAQAEEMEPMSEARRRIAALMREGEEAGVLSASQATLVDRALALSRVCVEDEMVPWAQVRAVEEDWPRERVLKFVASTGHARLPVVDRKGRVLGILRQIDLYVEPRRSVAELIAEPARMAPSTDLITAARRLTDCGARVGVVERNGRPIGLVTPRDLFEPLTGKLADW